MFHSPAVFVSHIGVHKLSSNITQHRSATLPNEHVVKLMKLMVAGVVRSGKDVSRQRHPSKSEHEAAAMSKAHKLDLDLDHMFAWLLSAYERPVEAMGDKQVLQQMSSSVKLIEHIDGDDADDNGKPAFTATRQVIQWYHLANVQLG